jgi:hypothetical protein
MERKETRSSVLGAPTPGPQIRNISVHLVSYPAAGTWHSCLSLPIFLLLEVNDSIWIVQCDHASAAANTVSPPGLSYAGKRIQEERND